ncbi:hypothetical protein OG728_00455 [Streptomyces microflavus]|uniref:DUF7224 domain-containing protein n=1 Tax=Streptomyces microflavus TaxID=1919 RepID=UPI002E122ABC|nr:hypothetical protein OG728_00455 [Streptomyces microflavus]
MTGLRIELRTSPMAWWLLGMTAVGLGWLFTQAGDWAQVWLRAAAAVQATVVFLGPMAAAAAAVAAGRVHRNTAAALTDRAARPLWVQSAIQLAATALYTVVPYFVVTLVALARPLTASITPGGPWPSYILLGMIAMLVCVGVGHAAGRLIAGPVAPAAAAVATFVCLGVLASDSPYNLTVISGAPNLRLNPSALAIRLVLAIAVLLVAVALSWPAHRSRTTRNWAVPSAGAALVMGAVAVMGQLGYPQIDRRPVDPLCSTGTPQVCVWPENEAHLEATARLAEKVAAAAGGTIKLPKRFYEQGLKAAAEDEPDGFTLSVGKDGVLEGMITQIQPRPADCTLTDAGVEQFADADQALYAWLYARASGEATADGVLGKVLREPEAKQLAWARAQMKAITDAPCR